MTTRYQTQHYEDVARFIADIRRLQYSTPGGATPAYMADWFADLFAANNPASCIHCGDDVGTAVGCTNANGRTYDEHLFEGGFDRDRFLKACGLESED